ncbi:MAG: 6,7-dimethyl-8-ribityllumazine synthase [Flammeovirgaceae bacterium TMED32]|nr:MAG: 6,7-dimethyl-8-ribityllumazine synthase [Flammeovirgaceae bacterium TMED32]
MASTIKNLSTFIGSDLPDITSKKFGLVVSEWNDEITHALMCGALETLLKYGAKKENIIMRSVPGSFELTLGAQSLAQDQHIDAVLCLGCVIQGETPHFDFICNAVAQGITSLNLKFHKPVVFGILTTHTLQQAIDRSGGKHGNKGDEAAMTGIKMLNII